MRLLVDFGAHRDVEYDGRSTAAVVNMCRNLWLLLHEVILITVLAKRTYIV